MSKPKHFRATLLIAAVLAASGCSVLKHKTKKTPILGERIPVLTTESDAQLDVATAAQPMTLPDAVANTAWAQSGGNSAKSMGQLALGTALTNAFTIQAGRGSSLTARLRRADGRDVLGKPDAERQGQRDVALWRWHCL